MGGWRPDLGSSERTRDKGSDRTPSGVRDPDSGVSKWGTPYVFFFVFHAYFTHLSALTSPSGPTHTQKKKYSLPGRDTST